MADKEEYGIEDICTSLDAIEMQLKRLINIMKLQSTVKTTDEEIQAV